MDGAKTKTALITGGTKGIGYGIAEALMQEGINLAITGRKLSTAEVAARNLNKSNLGQAKAIGLEADVRSYESQQHAVRQTMEEFGKIDIVIANAGLGHFASVEEISIEDWNETIDTNLTGVFF